MCIYIISTIQSNRESLIRELPQPAWSHPKYYPVQLSVDQVNSTNSLEADAQQVMKEACNDGFALGARNLSPLCTLKGLYLSKIRGRLRSLATVQLPGNISWPGSLLLPGFGLAGLAGDELG